MPTAAASGETESLWMKLFKDFDSTAFKKIGFMAKEDKRQMNYNFCIVEFKGIQVEGSNLGFHFLNSAVYLIIS